MARITGVRSNSAWQCFGTREFAWVLMPTYVHIPEVDGRPPDSDTFRCFENLSPALLAFASRHSLLVRKYYHNQPMWSFHFLHPRGGFGMLQVHAAQLNGEVVKAAIASHWWIDDEQRCSRSSLSTGSVALQSSKPDDLVSVLENALSHLLKLEPVALSSLSHTMPRKRDKAGNYVFSDFERAQRIPT
jgi:hypothetical protein